MTLDYVKQSFVKAMPGCIFRDPETGWRFRCESAEVVDCPPNMMRRFRRMFKHRVYFKVWATFVRKRVAVRVLSGPMCANDFAYEKMGIAMAWSFSRKMGRLCVDAFHEEVMENAI